MAATQSAGATATSAAPVLASQPQSSESRPANQGTGSQPADQAKTPTPANPNDHRNLANQDQATLDANGNFNASGWHASAQTADRPYHWMIVVDQNNRELDRQDVTNQAVSRPDVAKAYPNLYNAGDSGFRVHFDLSGKLANVTSVRLISRYSTDAAGNADYVDYWFAPVTIDRKNYAWLDHAAVADNTFTVSGWHATNDTVGRPNHYVILFDRTTGREITRRKVTDQARTDVAEVLPGVAGAGQSGFQASFNANQINFNHSIQVISRYSADEAGNANYVDYWFNPLTTGQNTNQAFLDQFNLSNGQLTISGWHADDVSQYAGQHFLILYDNTSHQQVAVQKVTAQARSDVAKAYPQVHTAGQAGFSANFDLSGLNLQPGHSYSVVSRYSTSSAGNGDNGQATDYWFAPIVLNQQAGYLDGVQLTDQGLQVRGWMASDQALNHTHPFVVVLNDGKVVAQQAVTLTNRSDVAKVYPGLYNSAQSGFETLVKLDPAQLTGTMQVVLRFSADPNGQQNNADQVALTSAPMPVTLTN